MDGWTLIWYDNALYATRTLLMRQAGKDDDPPGFRLHTLVYNYE